MPSSVEGLVFEGDGLEPGTHAELMQGLSDVLVDSSWTDTELLRDRFGRELGSDPGHDCQRSSKTRPVVLFENGTKDPGSGGGSQRSVGVGVALRPVRGLAFGSGAGTGCSKV